MFKRLWTRFTSDTPGFWKDVIKIGIGVGALGAAMMEPHVAEQLPPFLDKLSGYLVTVGVVAAGLAKFTVTDSSAKK